VTLGSDKLPSLCRFSYGTLQQENVQLSTFGRVLQGEKDDLLGFEQTVLKIDDPQVVATSGTASTSYRQIQRQKREPCHGHSIRDH
jgi:hypothetical protein